MKCIKIKKKQGNSWKLNFSDWIFVYQKFKYLLNIVIKKGWGIRPSDALATLCFLNVLKNKEGAKFYFIPFAIVVKWYLR